MKTRNSLVSNSSSSSFIVRMSDVNDIVGLAYAISQNSFGIRVLGIKKDIRDWPLKVVTRVAENGRGELAVKIPHLEDFEEIDDSDYPYIGEKNRAVISDGIDNLDQCYQILKLLKDWADGIAIWTGGTHSQIEPQTYLQCCLLDLKIPYEVCGDGSYDLRDIEQVKEMEKNCESADEKMIGPVRWIWDRLLDKAVKVSITPCLKAGAFLR